MTLSTSRQQFLAFEGQQAADDIKYGRRGGIFISTCVCTGLVIATIAAAALVGLLVYFVTCYKLSENSAGFWDENEPFGVNGGESADLRLPSDVVPSYYRLKIKADLQNSTFTGDVSITIKANKRVKEIILHAKDLKIKDNAKLTEQIYEKVQLYGGRTKRAAEEDEPKLGPESTERPLITEKPVNVSNQSFNKNNTISNSLNATKAVNTPQPQLNITETTTSAPITENPIKVDNVTEVPFEHTTEIGNNTFMVPNDETIVVEIPKPINEVTLSSMRNIKIISVTKASGDRLILTLASALKTNVDYTLELSFEGAISDSLTGFYKSTYINNKKEVRSLGVTQFEPTSARSAFPCFDEPQLKAMFEISVAHDKRLTALSNMRVATEEDFTDDPSWQWTHFERSVKMSTYLVAYIVSDFKSIQTSYKSQDNITKPIRVWARPELIEKAQYALSITPKILEYYEDVFGVPYALDKIDLIAIPDFSSGAMENWGLVTFRETTLLYDPTTSVPRDKQSVAIDVAHELAHQWFGNLVTMRWWTDLWLNEGFATYIEYVGVDKIEPEWKMFETFVRDKMDLLRSDALKNTSPVSRKVIDASEISQKFDEISYSKGANLIRMLNQTVGGQIFHDGLLNYLNKWKYSNAEENDLWSSMSSAAFNASETNLKDVSIVEFMNSWTRRAGYPVVTARRNYVTGEVEFEQHLFTTSRLPYKSMTEQIWQIPISYKPIDSKQEQLVWLKDRSVSLPVNVSEGEALYVNIDAIGYYRVNYDTRNWELLRDALKSNRVKSPVARAQLLDDAFNLAKIGQLDYSYALDMTTYVINGESSKIVWDLLLNNMVFLRHNLKATSGYVYFQDFMKLLLAKQLKTLNYGLDKPKDDNEAFLIENLLSWECLVESERCLKWARTQFDSWAGQKDLNNNPIPTYLRPLVYNMALKHGGRREFEFLWSVFQNSTDPNVKSLIINNLPSTTQEGLITMLLEKSLNEIPKQYAASIWNFDSTVGAKIAQDFFIQNWAKVQAAFTQTDAFLFPGVLSGAFGTISSRDDIDKLKSFAMKHKEELLPISQTLQKLVDSAELRIGWLNERASAVEDWLRKYLAEKSPNVTMTTPSRNSTTPKITLNISSSAENNKPIVTSNTTASFNNGNPKNNSAVNTLITDKTINRNNSAELI